MHDITGLNLNFEGLYFPDGIAHLLDGLSWIVSGEKPPIEHDSTLALNRVRRFGKAFDRVGRQTNFAKLRMNFSFRIGHQGFQFFKDSHRAVNGIDPFPWPAAMRLLAAHDHEHVNPSFVAQLDFRRAVDD